MILNNLLSPFPSLISNKYNKLHKAKFLSSLYAALKIVSTLLPAVKRETAQNRSKFASKVLA